MSVSQAMRDTGLFQSAQSDRFHATALGLQDGVEAFYWAGGFSKGVEIPLLDDSDRICLSFTTAMSGHATRSFCDAPGQEILVRSNIGSIQYCPGRKGIYRQQGWLENLTVMLQPTLFEDWVHDGDRELRNLVLHGGVLDGHRGGELCATIHGLTRILSTWCVGSNATPRHPLWLQAQAMSIIGLFLESRGTVPLDGVSPMLRQRLMCARDLLLADLSTPPLIPDLAREAGLSAPTLTRGFRRLFGTSPYGLFQHERMQLARHRLITLSASVTEVATELGYTNLSHFSAAFRKQFGVLPSKISASGKACSTCTSEEAPDRLRQS